MYDRLDKKKFSIVQKYEYDVKVSRTRTFVRGQRRTKVRPCGRTVGVGFFVRRTRGRRTNERACFNEMGLLSSLAIQIKWCFYQIYTINCFIY